MHGKKYDDTKKEIRSVLITYQDSVALDVFLRTYKGMIGQKLPSRDLGYSTDVAFLKSMPDAVDVQIDSRGKVFLTGIADKASEHIQKLVGRQKKPRSTNSKRNQFDTRQPVRKLPNTLPNTRELKPFLPGALRAEILELMNSCKYGLTLSAFALTYHQKFKKFLPLVKGLNSLEAMIKLIPELEIERNDNNEKVIYNKKFLNNVQMVKESYGKAELPSRIINDKNAVQEKSSPDIHESGIPDDILQDFQMILRKCPDGIKNIHFPSLYKNITGKPFDIIELGYNSMADLVEALPHIFKRISNPSNEQCWLIYPSASHIEEIFEAQNDPDISPRQHLYHHREGIPDDVSSPTVQYIQSSIPSYINLKQYVPVFVSAIANPSLFWFQLQTVEFIEKIEKFEKDLWNFYSNASSKYKMNSADIAIGATCVIQCPDDHQYYRAVIMSIPSADLINVSFVDYGSRDNVPMKNLYYVCNRFHKYPAFAFKARLSGLKPSENADSWSIEARKRFIDLCNRARLMALIKYIDQNSYSVCLCDTSEDDDIYLDATLINEGYAESCDQNHFDIKTNNSSDLEGTSNSCNSPVDSDSSFTCNKDKLQSDNSDSFSELNELSINRKLSFSTDVQNNVVYATTSQFNQVKNFRRYIKQIEVCKGNKVHLINLENKLFMSCDELCGLLWSEKDSNFLIRRLMFKEIDIPFLHIKKEDYSELFKQGFWYKIPGFEKNDSYNSSVILCPLDEAFNVLNIFGHPSVCIRIIIQHEIKIFNPHDEFWNEFSYEKSPDLSDIKSDILEEINKLCLDDLKAKSEAFKVQKLKHLQHIDPCSEEIKRIDNILSIITRRIKQIEAICTQYSHCS